jgi:small subunit ribosomal protein S8
MDPLADTLSAIKNAERVGKAECTVPSSKIIGNMLKVMKEKNYINGFELIEDGKSGKFRVELSGKINECGVIKPRHSLGKDEFDKWEKRFLPAKNFGMLIMSTPKGVMAHSDAKEQKIGGTLIAYIY